MCIPTTARKQQSVQRKVPSQSVSTNSNLGGGVGFKCGRVNKGVAGWRESNSNPATTIGSRKQTNSLTGRDLMSNLRSHELVQ